MANPAISPPGRCFYLRPPAPLLDGIRERDVSSAALSRPQPNQTPLPPPQLAAYQDSEPYQAQLPNMAWLAHRATDDGRTPALRWLTTMVYSLAAARVPMAQLLAAAVPLPAPSTTSDADQAHHQTQQRGPDELHSPRQPHEPHSPRRRELPHLHLHHHAALAEAAEHLRHVARIVQQLAAALADNLDHDALPGHTHDPEAEEC